MDNGKSASLLTLDNGNDSPTRITYLESSNEKHDFNKWWPYSNTILNFEIPKDYSIFCKTK